MSNFISKCILFLSMALLVSGCTITRSVTPVSSGTVIQKIFVQRNPDVMMDGFHPELTKQIQALGFQVETYEGKPPDSAHYYMTYTANWQWDYAICLIYFEATLYEGGKPIGKAEYDARKGGFRMSKYGHTADKIRPLIVELFKNVDSKSPATSNSSIK